MKNQYPLSIILHSDNPLRVGTNHLQLIVRKNNSNVAYKKVTIWLSPPLGVSLNVAKLRIAPFLIEPEIIEPLTLTTNQPGTYSIQIRAEPVPRPAEGNYDQIHQIEVLPKSETNFRSIKHFRAEKFYREGLETSPNAQNFNLKNIRTLLNEGFTDDELRRLCFDEVAFKPVCNQLSSSMGKDKIVDKFIEYAERRELMERLLDLAKEHNPEKYRKYQPYRNLTDSGAATRDPYIPSHKDSSPNTINIFVFYRMGLEILLNQLEKASEGYALAI
ncbi:MAG: hypothetical protein KDJ97_12890, partial [Anaerolineae bacterium]|nr:hypothetical protein [Anaerolineae bacterium]